MLDAFDVGHGRQFSRAQKRAEMVDVLDHDNLVKVFESLWQTLEQRWFGHTGLNVGLGPTEQAVQAIRQFQDPRQEGATTEMRERQTADLVVIDSPNLTSPAFIRIFHETQVLGIESITTQDGEDRRFVEDDMFIGIRVKEKDFQSYNPIFRRNLIG